MTPKYLGISATPATIEDMIADHHNHGTQQVLPMAPRQQLCVP